ncbi:MAG: response regulator [Thermodesulfobacteriota bacterium]
MQIRSKIIAGYLLASTMIFIIGYAGYRSAAASHLEFLTLTSHVMPICSALQNIRSAGMRINSSVSEYGFISAEKKQAPDSITAWGEKEENALIEEGIAQYTSSLVNFKSLVAAGSAGKTYPIGELERAGERLIAIGREILRLKHSGESGSTVLARKEALEQAEKMFLLNVDELIARETAEIAAQAGLVDEALGRARNTVLIVGGLMLAALVMLAIALAQRISGPVRELERAVTRVAEQDLDILVAERGDDEVGRLAAAYNRMVARLRQAKIEEVTARNRAEEANRAKNQFLANMSHQLRTPMHTVLGTTRLLKETELSSEQRLYLDMLAMSGKRLGRLIDDLLDLARIETGRTSMTLAPFSLCEAVDEVVVTHRRKAATKGLSLAAHISPQLPERFVGDSGKLVQILQNLVDNAVKFTSEGGVELRVEPGEDLPDGGVLLHFSVQDSGIGIEEDKRRLLFDVFTRTDCAPLRSQGSTGLGLPLCSGLAALMGGRLWLEDPRPAVIGSTFHFTLPLFPAPAVPNRKPGDLPAGRAPAQPAQMADTGARILLVEDDEVNRAFCTALLEKRGHQVVAVENGRAAVDQSRRHRFDLVLMDIQMPEMDGISATAAIRRMDAARGWRLPIIAITAHAMQEDRDRCLAAGMDDYIAKPVDIDELLLLVQTYRTGGAHRDSGDAAGPS